MRLGVDRVKVLVTGATGKVGNAVARALHARRDDVAVLARTPDAARGLLPDGVKIVQGDVTDPPSVDKAVHGCEFVFNAMGIPEQWVKDEDVFERVNARGAETVVKAARDAGVRRVVQTSTIDVFEADADGRLTEERLAPNPQPTAHQHSQTPA